MNMSHFTPLETNTDVLEELIGYAKANVVVVSRSQKPCECTLSVNFTQYPVMACVESYLDLSIGIDFGTSSCQSSHFDDNHIVIHLDELQNHSTPAYLTFDEKDQIKMGDLVKKYYEQSVNQTLNGIKRILSETKSDPKIDPFEFALRKTFFKEQTKMAKLVMRLKVPLTHAVIAVPDCFGERELETLRQAAYKAEFEKVEFLQDTLAAALAYGFDNDIDPPKQLLIFSLGGGFLSIRYFNKVGNGFIEWDPEKFVSEGTGCGGEVFTEVLINHLREYFKEKSGVNILAKPMWRHNVRLQAERLKHQLQRKIPVKVDGTTFGASDEVEVTYGEFLEMSSGILERIRVCLDDMEKKLHPKIQIKEILLVGGSSRLCAVRDLIKEVFPEARFTEAINADEAVVYGAGLYAHHWSRDALQSIATPATNQLTLLKNRSH